MSREEYETKLNALQKEMADLKFEYIRSNSKIPNGTKVKIHYKHYGDEYGIVIGYDISFGEVLPIVAKMKKDGTAHATARLYVSYNTNVEKCD